MSFNQKVVVMNVVQRAALMLVMFSSLVLGAVAQANVSGPQQVVEGVTQSLFADVKRLKASEIDDATYLARVKSTLEPVVNFPFIAAHVMGQQAYAKATAEQRQAFSSVFRDGLIGSYAKGISGYANSDIKVVSVVADAKNPKRVTVAQEVSDNGAIHKLDYTMVQGKEGDWKVINVTLNGVNLGMSFSSQFKSSMRKYGNDLDKVISNWLADA